MSKPISTTERYYRYGAPYRYVAMHFGSNRAERRGSARRNPNRRDPHTGKLLTPPSVNVPYLTPPPPQPAEEPTNA